jgi:hypothetical protein
VARLYWEAVDLRNSLGGDGMSMFGRSLQHRSSAFLLVQMATEKRTLESHFAHSKARTS